MPAFEPTSNSLLNLERANFVDQSVKYCLEEVVTQMKGEGKEVAVINIAEKVHATLLNLDSHNQIDCPGKHAGGYSKSSSEMQEHLQHAT